MVVDLRAVEEHDHIGVLLQGAGLAQVRELWPMVFAPLLRRPGELGKRHHGHVQLLGQFLEGAGDVGNLQVAVLMLAAAPHQLQVIDDDEIEAVLLCQASRFGAHFQDRDARRVIDEDGRLIEHFHRTQQLLPFALAQAPGAQAMAVHPGMTGQKPEIELFLAHLEAEQAHRAVVAHSGVLGDIQAEGGLAHGGAGGNEDQVSGLQSRGFAVQFLEAGADSGDLVFAGHILQAGHRLVGDIPHTGKASPVLILGDGKDQFFSSIQDLAGILLRSKAVLDHAVGSLNHFPQHRLVLHDAGIMIHVGGAGHAVRQRRQGGGASGSRQVAGSTQHFLEGDQVDGLGAFTQFKHGGVDAFVSIAIEVARFEPLLGGVHGTVIDKDGAQD